jgi:hypothetical protein
LKIVARDELKLVKKITEMPSIEVDLASFPDGMKAVKSALKHVLPSFIANKKSIRATLYYYRTASVNFHRHTDSVFIGVAGDKKLLDLVYMALKKSDEENARESDYITPSQSKRFMHIQEGDLWVPCGEGRWSAVEKIKPIQPELEQATQLAGSTERQDPSAKTKYTADSENEKQTKPKTPRFPDRDYLAADEDTIKATRAKIASMFGLPESSILLCGPDLEPLRGNTTVATLKKRWRKSQH